MTDRLTEQLTDIADEIAGTDMYDKVMAGSRRLRHRRALVAGFAALAVVVGLTGTAFAILPDRPGSPPADGAEDEVIEGAANIPGTLVYLAVDDQSLTGYLHSDGRLVDRAGVDNPSEPGEPGYVWNSINETFGVSTDDQYMAYVEFDTSLRVFEFGTDRTVPLTDPATADSLDVFCGQPSWSPTGPRILYQVPFKHSRSGSELRVSDVTTGELVHITAPSICDYTWAADGESVVYGHAGTNSYTVSSIDGGQQRDFSVPGYDDEDPLDLVNVSADAELACFSTAAFPSRGRALSCDVLVDTATGEQVELPGWDGDGTLRTVRFLPDGGALVRATDRDGTTSLHLIEDGREIAADLEPAEYAGMELLDYHR